MSYYDDCDDEYSSDEDIFYHNYSVDYANQILNGHHAVSSCLPIMRRKHRKHSSQLVRVSTLDQIPSLHNHETLPSLHSRPKFNHGDHILSMPFTASRLPSLEATSEELERRATRRPQPLPQEIRQNDSPITNINTITTNTNNDNNLPSQNAHQPLTENELRQVQQQQEAFQQHLLNMQRHLSEQQQQLEQNQEKVPMSNKNEKQSKLSYHGLQLDDDQAEIAELIENDPYIAAAMEDFAYTHGLLQRNRHRTDSDYSSSQHSQHLSKRHRTQYNENYSRRSSSPSLSMSSFTNVSSPMKESNLEVVLLSELRGIRHLMEDFLRNSSNMINQRGTSGVHYPPVEPVTDYRPAMVPRERAPPPEPNRILYQNVVDTIKEVMDRRSPSQREQQLKPSDISSKYKYAFKRQPPSPPSNNQAKLATLQRPSQTSSPSIKPSSTISSSNAPPAPPYEALANFSSSRSLTNQNRNLSYGNRQKQMHIYDRLLPGHYLNLYMNKYN